MGKSLTKSQIAEHMATKTGLTKKAATQLLEDFAALAYKEAEKHLHDSRHRQTCPGQSQGPHGTESSDRRGD